MLYRLNYEILKAYRSKYEVCTHICISADCHLRRGVALQIREMFGRVSEIERQRKGVGEVAVLDVGPRYVYHLVTKRYYYHRPSLSAVAACLLNLKRHMHENHVSELAVPLLASGLDRLYWPDIERLLSITFHHSGVTIYIYTL